MAKKSEKDDDRKEPVRDRMFTGSRPYISSTGNREVRIKSWTDTID